MFNCATLWKTVRFVCLQLLLNTYSYSYFLVYRSIGLKTPNTSYMAHNATFATKRRWRLECSNHEKLSCRREAARCLMSLNISLSHLKSLTWSATTNLDVKVIWRRISHKRYEIEAQLQWNTNRDLALNMAHSWVSFRMTLSDLERQQLEWSHVLWVRTTKQPSLNIR